MSMQMNSPITVEVLTPNPPIFNECVECEFVWKDIDLDDPVHRRHILSHLPPDSAQEYLNLSIWVAELIRRYGGQVSVRCIDADSLEGITKSGQYGINSYPAIVIDRRRVYNALSLDQATEDIASRVCEAVPC